MDRLFSRMLAAVLAVFIVFSTAFAGDLPVSGALKGAQAHQLLDEYSSGGLTLVDVRSPDEFNSGHAPGAINIPLDQLGQRLAEVPEGPVLLVCRSGRRAQSAYKMLVRSGRSTDDLWYLAGSTDYSGEKPRFR